MAYYLKLIYNEIDKLRNICKMYLNIIKESLVSYIELSIVFI
jgi:hypothetical protein